MKKELINKLDQLIGVDEDSKFYKGVFERENCTWNEKLEICEDYAMAKVRCRIRFNNILNLYKSTGVMVAEVGNVNWD